MMNTVFETFDKATTAMVNPQDFIKPVPGFSKRCITTYSEKIIQEFAEKNKAEQIATLYSANGELPVYKVCCKGEDIAFYLSRVGGAASAAGLEEVIAMGAFFYGTDSLDGNEWDIRDLTDYGYGQIDNYMKIALACALLL